MGWFRWGRERDEATEPAAPALDVDTDEPAPFVAARDDSPSPGDWMAMPPMARTVGPAPSRLGNVQRLSDMMTTRRPLALTGTLGHRVSPLAPAGSVEGLATAVTSRPHEVDGGGGDLTLRAPVVHRDEPDAPVAPVTPALSVPHDDEPIVQREVPVTASSTPSLSTITEARLPSPPPARALHEPLPLPGRDVGAENPPRPLAVVQRQPAAAAAAPTAPTAAMAATAAAAPAASPAATSSPAPDVAPAKDAPVGGTPIRPVSAPDMSTVDDDTPSAIQTGDATVVDLPLAATAPPAASPGVPMEDVMPPIQPRAIQRRVAEAAGASARPETAADAPLPPLPDWARPVQPSSTPTMPLQHPTVQREAAPAHHAGDAHDHSADDAQDEAQDGALGGSRAEEPGIYAPLAGDAAPIAATPNAPNAAASATNAGPASGADTAAVDLPLHASAANATDAATAVDLPLHANTTNAATAPPAVDEAPESPANLWNAPSERLPSDRAPEPEPAPVLEEVPAVQRMTGDSATAAGAAGADADAPTSTVPLLGDRPLPLHAEGLGRAGGDGSPQAGPEARGEALPLAPDASATGGPTLATVPSAPSAPDAASPPSTLPASPPSATRAPSAPSATAPSAPGIPGALAAVSRSVATPTGASNPAGRSIAAQREPLAGGGTTANRSTTTTTPARAGGTAATGAVALPLRALPSVPERPAASPGTGGPLTDPLPVTPPVGPPPVPAMDAPLAFHAVPSFGAASSLAAETLPDVATTTLPVQTLPLQTPRAPAAPGATAVHTAPMPLQAPVQRSVDTPSASSNGATAASTGAGATPSIGDLAIASGLGVRQPDGSVLFTRQEPAPSYDGASVQRAIDAAPAATAHAFTTAAADTDGRSMDGPAATMPDLDLLARRLFPRIRRLLANEVRTGQGRMGDGPWNRH